MSLARVRRGWPKGAALHPQNTILKLFTLLATGALLLSLTLLAASWNHTYDVELDPLLPRPLDSQGQPVARGFVHLEQVRLGGIDQWILIRGHDPEKPVLLVLHGGPGASLMPWVERFQTAALEREFVVVHWDQRGAGKSFDPSLGIEDLTVGAFVDDTLELTDLLRARFGEQKIFLTGHSWGSALGFLTIDRDSSPFHAFIPSGERVDWRRSHQLGFDWIEERALEGGDQALLEQLSEARPFDAADEADLGLVYEGLDLFGGGDVHTPGLWAELLEFAVSGQGSYYAPADLANYLAGAELAGRAIKPFALDYDLFREVPRTDIPVHFIQGEHDHNTPEVLSREYFDFLDAPDKTYTVIPGAGHSMMFDQPDAWARALCDIKRRTLGS